LPGVVLSDCSLRKRPVNGGVPAVIDVLAASSKPVDR
jgi:hypothetical protein